RSLLLARRGPRAPRVAGEASRDEGQREEGEPQPGDLAECREAEPPHEHEHAHEEGDPGEPQPQAPGGAQEAARDALEAHALLERDDERADEGLAAVRAGEPPLERHGAAPAQPLETGPAGADGRRALVIEALHGGDFGATAGALDRSPGTVP